MAYAVAPKKLRKGSTMHYVLSALISNPALTIFDFSAKQRKDALYPSYRHGFVKVSDKTGSVKITKIGKALLKTVC